MTTLRFIQLFAVLAVVVGLVRVAAAQEAESCSVAYARGQEERLAGRLFNARAAFQRCASEACSTLASDCSRWVEEVEADLPTIRVKVSDEHGARVPSAKVAIDGVELELAELKEPIVLEAGPHEIRVQAPGYEPARFEKALRPTDREVEVVVTLRPPSPKQPPHVDRVPTASWLLAGVGAVALGGSIYFGVRANDEYQELKDSCAPECQRSASDGMWRSAVIADAALAGAVVAFAASAVVYFTRPTKPAVAALGLTPTPRGARAGLLLAF